MIGAEIEGPHTGAYCSVREDVAAPKMTKFAAKSARPLNGLPLAKRA